MKHPERVEDYLGHIAEAIARATGYVEPLPGIEAFRQNPLVQDGVVRNIEIIGEAANQIARVAPEFIAQHPELPWAEMRNMRNIVIHAYFNVDLTTVWRTVQEDFPKLNQQVEHLLNQRQSDRYREHVPGYDPPQQTESMRDPDAGRERDDEHELD
jgi:uncharacterized protein with HEPN domain